MFEDWKRNRAAKRVRPGDGRALQPFRWWQLLRRSLFLLEVFGRDGHPVGYAVDVRHWADKETGESVAHLYVDGRHHAYSRVPAMFAVEGGTIEVAASQFGLKRCHYVAADGAERQLIPDPRSAEGRRARLDSRHPSLSRSLGFVSVVMLLVGVALLVLQVAEPISEIPPVADSIGTFESPIHLPLWLNLALGLGAVAASTERALRLRFSWLDSLGN